MYYYFSDPGMGHINRTWGHNSRKGRVDHMIIMINNNKSHGDISHDGHREAPPLFFLLGAQVKSLRRAALEKAWFPWTVWNGSCASFWFLSNLPCANGG